MVNAVVFFVIPIITSPPAPPQSLPVGRQGVGGLKPLSDKGFKRFMNFYPDNNDLKMFKLIIICDLHFSFCIYLHCYRFFFEHIPYLRIFGANNPYGYATQMICCCNFQLW